MNEPSTIVFTPPSTHDSDRNANCALSSKTSSGAGMAGMEQTSANAMPSASVFTLFSFFHVGDRNPLCLLKSGRPWSAYFGTSRFPAFSFTFQPAASREDLAWPLIVPMVHNCTPPALLFSVISKATPAIRSFQTR